MKLVFKVEVVSDVICPWCWVGKRCLEKAIALLGPDAHVTVRWRPFQLNPTMPKAGIDRNEYRMASVEKMLASDVGLKEVIAEEAQFKAMGIDCVPGFVINGQFLFSGAAEPKVIVAAFRDAISSAS